MTLFTVCVLGYYCPKIFSNFSTDVQTKGPYFNYISTFLSISDQLSTLVSIFTTVPDNSYSTVVSI